MPNIILIHPYIYIYIYIYIFTATASVAQNSIFTLRLPTIIEVLFPVVGFFT